MSDKQVEPVRSGGNDNNEENLELEQLLFLPKVQNVPTTFPANLHHFLEVASETHPECVSWTEDGTCFYMDDTRPDLQGLMKKFFHHGNFASLRRQMNSYGFRKGRNNRKGYGLWSHPGFLRCSKDFSNVKFHGSHQKSPEPQLPALGENGDLVGRIPRKCLKAEESPSSAPLSFPEVLHKFATKMGQSNANMVSFTVDGCAFHIQLDDPDLGATLRTNFGERKISSFLQTLAAHGWKRFGDERMMKGYYQRTDFHRDLSKCDFTKILRRVSVTAAKTNGEPKTTKTNDNSAVEHDDDMSVQSTREELAESSSSDEHEGRGSPHSKKSDADDKGGEDPSSQEPTGPPAPKFKVFQTVFARDTDGVMYEAVVRRRLYGQSQHKQVQMGLVASVEEADELLSQEPEAMWHYFVHYNKWNVNWDRWVLESNLYEPSDRVRAYADRLLSEHRALRAELTKKVKGKKGHQTVEGSEFLQRWRLRMAQVEKEMSPDGDSAKPPAAPVVPTASGSGNPVSRVSKQPKKLDTWSKAAIATEKKLRERRLTGKYQHSNKLALPFALKKNLVESWEVITQCQMVLSLPAPMTVRQALDKYLESKGVACELAAAVQNHPGIMDSKATATHDIAQTDRGKRSRDNEGNNEENTDIDGDDSRDHEWREMADGIALLFDESLPNRLLYREEYPQFNVLCDHPEHSLKRFSDIYGCEHLLRLFVRLPEVVADEMSEAEARPILAKVNDFVRFLHKNQGTMFAQPYRKLNDVEAKEQSKLIKMEERKRKRRSDLSEDEAVAKKPKTD